MVDDYTYDDWAELIDGFFFDTAHGSREVLFAVDDMSLAEMSGHEEGDAARSLASAVLSVIGPTWRVSAVNLRVQLWRRDGTDGPHPALPFLALTVLAASRMGQYDGFAPHKFYVPLRRTLREGDLETDAPGSYLDYVRQLWADVATWCFVERVARHGVILVRDPGRHYGRGLAMQHALVKSYDLRQLDLFFRRIGLEPGDDVPATELRRALAAWTARRREPWATRLNRVTTEPELTEYAEALLERAAANWDGQPGDPRTGRPVGRLRLVLGTPRRPNLGIAAEYDERLPESLTFRLPTGAEIDIARQRDWYTPTRLDGIDLARVLDEGLDLRAGRQRFVFNDDEAYAFGYDVDLGSWVSTDAIRYGDQHHLLVYLTDLDEILRFLTTVSTTPPRVDERATRALLPAWRLITGVRIDARPPVDPPDALTGLIPAGAGPRLRLLGGLPLPVATRTYLRGGEPALALSTLSDDREYSIRKGAGEPQRFSAAGVQGEVPLWAFDLEPDLYEATHGDSSVRFQIVDGIAEAAGPGVGLITQTGRDGVEVIGTRVAGEGSNRHPITVPAPTEGGLVVLLGPQVGDVETVGLPVWLAGVFGFEPSWRTIDAWPAFEPAWLLVRNPGERTMASPLQPLEPVEGPGTTTWHRLIGIATLYDWVTDDGRARWERYQRAAEVDR